MYFPEENMANSELSDWHRVNSSASVQRCFFVCLLSDGRSRTLLSPQVRRQPAAVFARNDAFARG